MSAVASGFGKGFGITCGVIAAIFVLGFCATILNSGSSDGPHYDAAREELDRITRVTPAGSEARASAVRRAYAEHIRLYDHGLANEACARYSRSRR